MIKLNDYLYSGNTVLKILHQYKEDLKMSAIDSHNEVDLVHCDFLSQIIDLLEHNDFLTAQSQKLRKFYKYMVGKYPYLAFTFKGRIKSLIRAEEKFNGYIVKYIYDYYCEHKSYPSVSKLKEQLTCFRDLIAYRIVISMPKCHLKEGQACEIEELKCLYEIANDIPKFLEKLGFIAEVSGIDLDTENTGLIEEVRPYYRDYIVKPNSSGYRSLHITFFDTSANCYFEVQLRTKGMDDYAEIGPANHLGYEKRQQDERRRRDAITIGECLYFDEAYERGINLQKLELASLDVNMFSAVNNSLINDGCGLFRGRSILPYEHLSRFQSDLF